MPYTKTPGLNENLAGSDLFIYAESGEELLVLNQSALFIWSLCEDHDQEELLARMALLYPDAEPDALRKDIADCLENFVSKGLLENPD